MNKNWFEPRDKAALLERLEKIQSETTPTWGTMTATAMLRHLAEGCKITLGDLKLPDQSTFMRRTLIRYFVLKGAIPSEKMRAKNPIQTMPEIDVVKAGMPLADFDTEKKNLLHMLARVDAQTTFPERHPLFGKFRKKQWGMHLHAHLHYHFTQFGV